MAAAVGDQALDRTDVAIVAGPGDGDALVARDYVVGGIKITKAVELPDADPSKILQGFRRLTA